MSEVNAIPQRITISHSKRQNAKCLHFFKKRHIDRVPMPKNAYLDEGIFLHEVASTYTEQLFKHKLTADIELLELVFKELWKAQSVLPEDYYDDLYSVTRLFGERFVLDLDHFLAAEYGIAFTDNLEFIEFPRLHSYEDEDKWCQENGIWVHQRLDVVYLIGTVAKIVDYKSARAVTSESELKKRGQGKQYAWALFQINPYIEKVIVIFDFIRFDNAQVEIEYTREDVADVEQVLRTFTEKISERLVQGNAATWPAIQNDETCSICRYPCPLNDASLSTPRIIQDDETAYKLAQKARALDRERKEIEDRLKVFTKERIPLNIEIGTYGWNPSVSLKGLQPATLVDIFLKKGMDINAFLKIDSEAVKILINTFCEANSLNLVTFEHLTDEELKTLQGDLPLVELRRSIKEFKVTTRFGFKEAEKPKKARKKDK